MTPSVEAAVDMPAADQHTPVTVRQTLSRSAALVVLDLVSKLLPLVTFPLVVRALGPSTYGKLGVASALVAFAGLLASPGFSTYAARETARRDGRDLRDFAGVMIGLRLVFAVASYGVLAGIALAVEDPTLRLLIAVSGLALVIESVHLQWMFLGAWRLWIVAIAGVVGQVIYAATLLAFVRQPEHAWMVPAGAVAGTAVSAALLAREALKRGALTWPRFSPHVWKAVLPVCLTLGAASTMSVIYDQLDVLMLKALRSDIEVGLYVAAVRVMAMSLAFSPILAQVFFTLLSRTAGTDAEQVRYLRWMGTAAVGLALPIAAGGWLLAEPLQAFLLGPRYADAALLLRLLMLNVVAAALATYWAGRLVPNDRAGSYLKAVAAGAGLNVVLNAVFIPLWGAPAAALTTAASQLMVAGMACYAVRDLPQPALGRALVLSVLSTGVMIGGLLVADGLRLHVTLLVALGAFVYGLSYWLATMCWPRAALAVGLKEL